MATISQRESGWWQAKVRVKGQPVQSKTFPTKREAEAWAQAVEADMRRGLYQSTSEAERTTLADVIDDFAISYAPAHYKSRSDQKEAWRFQCAKLRASLGAYALAAIDQKLVARYRDERLRSVGESTVRKELYMLSKLLLYAQNERGIVLPRGNPVERIRKPADSAARERRLSNDEWQAFEHECRKSRNPWLWPAVQLATETAMRQGELLSLRWSDIDFTRRIAMLHDTKNGEARAVPLSSAAVAVLRALPRSTTGAVLPVQRMTLEHAFMYARERAGIKNFRFHDLRHEALSRLAERGDLSVLELAQISGHKTLQMLKRYTHLQAEKLARKLG